MPNAAEAPLVPRPAPGVDPSALRLSPADAFLLSRLDGSLDEESLAVVTGVDPSTLRETLARLESLGAVVFVEAPPRATRTYGGVPSEPPSERFFAAREAATVEEQSARTARYDPRELDEECYLDRDRRARLLDLYYRLDELDHYEVLGVARETEKKAIKKAYYALAPEFHPDRFFGKALGSFKPKMEAVFARITAAHDTLTSNERRGEYDAYLAQLDQNRSLERALHPDAAAEVELPEPPPEAEAGAVSGSLYADFADEYAYADEAPAYEEPAPRPAAPQRTPEDIQRRREILARKLGGTRRTPFAPRVSPRATTPAPSTAPIAIHASPEAALRDLRRRQAAARVSTRRPDVARHLDAAARAEAKGDLAGAAQAYRMAYALNTQDAEVGALYGRASRAATAALAEGYVRQGDYEAAAGTWGEAARSYARAVGSLADDGELHKKLANALIRANGDQRTAADHARRAVALAPDDVEARFLWVEALITSRQTDAATKELDVLAEMAKGDARIALFAKRLK